MGAYDPRRPLVIDPVLSYATYLGGMLAIALGIAVDSSGNAYVTGLTALGPFPTSPTSFQPAPGGSDDAFVTKLNARGSALVYSSYFGGAGLEMGTGIAVDSNANAYVGGTTYSTDFPTTSGAYTTTAPGAGDAFIAKISTPQS